MSDSISYRGSALEISHSEGHWIVEIRRNGRGLHRITGERKNLALGKACEWLDDFIMGETHQEATDEDTRLHKRRR